MFLSIHTYPCMLYMEKRSLSPIWHCFNCNTLLRYLSCSCFRQPSRQSHWSCSFSITSMIHSYIFSYLCLFNKHNRLYVFIYYSLVDTTKSDSAKRPSPRQRDMKPVVYMESPKVEAHATNSSRYWGCCCCYNCCSLPQWSCPSCQHCWGWKWFNKWLCCSCC